MTRTIKGYTTTNGIRYEIGPLHGLGHAQIVDILMVLGDTRRDAERKAYNERIVAKERSKIEN